MPEHTALHASYCTTDTGHYPAHDLSQSGLASSMWLCLQGDKGSQVTLVIPWLAAADQAKVYPNNLTFSTPEEQESYVRAWVTKRTGFDCNFKVTFYPGRYANEMGSILPVGDPTTYIPDKEARRSHLVPSAVVILL